MPAYLVTGIGGSGKTTVCDALSAQGFAAYDGDAIPGLARWEERVTGEPMSVDSSGFINYTHVAWNWQQSVFDRFMADHRHESPLFICGSASNQETFYDRFAHIFILTLDPKTHAHRLMTRNSDYGKHPQMLQTLVAEQQTFAAQAVAAGAIAIDATATPSAIVQELQRYAA